MRRILPDRPLTTAERQQRYRGQDPSRCRAAQKAHREKRGAWLADLKDHPCMDCGNCFPPEAMDFDHVRGKKLFEVNRLTVTTRSPKRVLAEMAKCELVCACCHRVRTTARARKRRTK